MTGSMLFYFKNYSVKIPILLLTAMSTCILISSCQKSDLSENKDFLRNSANAEKEGNGVKKKNLAIGDVYGGGIIFFMDAAGKHGLIVAPQDLGLAPWGCTGTEVPGTSQFDGTGQLNTNLILAACSEATTAARLCNDLVIREKGDNGKKYDDWFLPSAGDFGKLTSAINSSSDPKLKSLLIEGDYWSSTQQDWDFKAIPQDRSKTAVALLVFSYETATDIDFTSILVPSDKSNRLRVIPIRAF